MKRVICVLMLILLVGCGPKQDLVPGESEFIYDIPKLTAPIDMELLKHTVLIDAGHGGFDPGAVCGGIDEDKINLKISQMLEKELTDLGYKVYMTRTDDEALSSSKGGDMHVRQEIITRIEADITLSIHLNAINDSSITGAMVFYYPHSKKSSELAVVLQDELNTLNRRPKKPTEGNKFVLRVGKGAAALVECGFLTNSGERYNLTQEWYQLKVAQTIAKGVHAYFDAVEGAEIPV